METAHHNQGGLFTEPKQELATVAKLRNLFTLNFEALAKDMQELLDINLALAKDNKEVVAKLNEVEGKYNALLVNYNKTLDAIEVTKKELPETLSVSSSAVLFDSAIHQYKPSRPITLNDRNLILSAYHNVYKKEDGIKTLPDFFAYVNNAINPTVSKTEIEGVIYNRFDERLYL